MDDVIIITKQDGVCFFFGYLEQVADWLSRVHGRQINIAEELEAQITDVSGCDFEIDGVKYHYEQKALYEL